MNHALHLIGFNQTQCNVADKEVSPSSIYKQRLKLLDRLINTEL